MWGHTSWLPEGGAPCHWGPGWEQPGHGRAATPAFLSVTAALVDWLAPAIASAHFGLVLHTKFWRRTTGVITHWVCTQCVMEKTTRSRPDLRFFKFPATYWLKHTGCGALLPTSTCRWTKPELFVFSEPPAGTPADAPRSVSSAAIKKGN